MSLKILDKKNFDGVKIGALMLGSDAECAHLKMNTYSIKIKAAEGMQIYDIFLSESIGDIRWKLPCESYWYIYLCDYSGMNLELLSQASFLTTGSPPHEDN